MVVVGVAEFPSSLVRVAVVGGVLSSFIFACSAKLVGVCWLKSAKILATTKRDELSFKCSLVSSPFLCAAAVSGLISLFPFGPWTIAWLDIDTRHSAAKWSISLKNRSCFSMTFEPNDSRPLNSVDPFVWCWIGSFRKQTHFALSYRLFSNTDILHVNHARSSRERATPTACVL